MALVVMSATAETAHADNCASGYVSGDFNLCYGSSASGDVRVDGNILYDSGAGSEGTGSVVTCLRQPFCNGYAQWGANVSNENSTILVAALYSHGCGSRCSYVRQVSCPSAECPNLTNQPAQPAPQPAVTYTRMYFPPGAPVMGGWIYINGSYVGYSCYVPSAWGSGYVDGGSVNPQFTQGASVTLCTGGTTVPVPAFSQPVYPSQGTTTSAGWTGSVVIAVGSNGSVSIQGHYLARSSNCWLPATGGPGTATFPLLNATLESHPELPFCGPIDGYEVRASHVVAGQCQQVRGIAVLSDDKTIVDNGGDVIVGSVSAARTGMWVFYLVPQGAPGDTTPVACTSYNTTPATPTSVFQGLGVTPKTYN